VPLLNCDMRAYGPTPFAPPVKTPSGQLINNHGVTLNPTDTPTNWRQLGEGLLSSITLGLDTQATQAAGTGPSGQLGELLGDVLGVVVDPADLALVGAARSAKFVSALADFSKAGLSGSEKAIEADRVGDMLLDINDASYVPPTDEAAIMTKYLKDHPADANGVRPGDHVAVRMKHYKHGSGVKGKAVSLFEHHAIVSDDKSADGTFKVYHHNGYDEHGVGVVTHDHFREFSHGVPHRQVNSKIAGSRQQVLFRARLEHEHPSLYKQYDLNKHQCEHFAYRAREGVNKSYQRRAILATTATVPSLGLGLGLGLGLQPKTSSGIRKTSPRRSNPPRGPVQAPPRVPVLSPRPMRYLPEPSSLLPATSSNRKRPRHHQGLLLGDASGVFLLKKKHGFEIV